MFPYVKIMYLKISGKKISFGREVEKKNSIIYIYIYNFD